MPSKDLTLRIEEVMHWKTDCQDGRDDTQHGTTKRGGAARESLGQIIYAGQAVSSNAQAGGTTYDLMFLRFDQPHFDFGAAAGRATQAATVS